MTYEKSCGAIVFTVENDVIKYVLVKQLEGFWAFKKGHIEAFETELGCAYREIHEEVGLNVKILAEFREVDEHQIPDKDVTKQIIYLCAYFEDQEIKKQDEELEDARLVTIEEAEKLIAGSEADKKYWFPRLELLKRADEFIKDRIREKEEAKKRVIETMKETLPSNKSEKITLQTIPCKDEFRRKVEEMMMTIDGDGFVDGSFE